MEDTSIADTSISQILVESRSIIYCDSEGNKSHAKEFSLSMIHKTLIQIETNSASLEKKYI